MLQLNKAREKIKADSDKKIILILSFMKPLTKIFVFLISIMLPSCSAEDPLPTSGENSFIANLNGEKFVAEDIHKFPSGTKYGLSVYKNEKIWLLTVNNSSALTLYFYLYEITGSGNYMIGEADNNLSFFDNNDNQTSVLIGDGSLNVLFLTKAIDATEYIKITKVQGDSIIVGEFEKITLTDPENPNNKTILTNGKFNINTNTLNQPEQ